MSEVKQHYERDGLTERIAQALSNKGFSDDKILSLSDLAPLDHFHSRGVAATQDLAQALDARPSSKILDIGSGLGGPARYLSEKFACNVTGIDLTQSYVDAATYLTERTGLQKRVSFDCGDALALPYSDASFDIVVTQHVAMNIEDRERFYCEAYRVLKPGGQFALYDVTAGEGMQPHFPVPWADSSATSFLKSQAELRDILQRQGFAVLKWLDRSADTITWFEAFTAAQSRYSADGSTMNAGAGGEPRPLNLSLVVGADFGARVDNLIRSLKENKVTVTEAILRK